MITAVLLAFMVGITTDAFPVATNEAVAKVDTQVYLKQFGYYSNLPDGRSNATPEDKQKAELSLALSQFQLLNGLPVTGELDEDTAALMGRPRCGVADIQPLGKDAGDYRWEKNALTWTVQNHTKHMDEGAARLAMREALEIWRAHMPNGMTFVEVPPGVEVDLSVQFGTNDHGDLWPFDGPGMILAHALYPPSGQVHFDDDEKWVYRDDRQFVKDKESVDLLQVALHEFGHALGLPHSRNSDAVMAPFYPEVSLADGFYKTPRLTADDVDQLKRIYGEQSPRARAPITMIPVETSPSPTTTQADTPAPRDTGSSALGDDPNRGCPDYIDAAVYAVSTGQTFVFADAFVWDFDAGRLSNKRLIAEAFPGGPARVTAASRTIDQETREHQRPNLNAERQVYNFYLNPSNGLAELKSGPFELPKDIAFEPNAACIRHDGNQLLIQGERMATYDEGRNTATYVGRLELHMTGFPSDATACMPDMSRDGVMIVFAPARYYLYDSKQQAVLEGYPRPLSQLIYCT